MAIVIGVGFILGNFTPVNMLNIRTMVMKKRMILGLLLFFSHLISASANTIGTVLFTTANVIVQQHHGQRSVTRGALLYSGDTIITDATGQAIIKYNNGSLVTIQPNSNYVTSPRNAPKNGELNAILNNGTIAYASTGKKRQGRIRSPIVSLAILGTQFTMSYSQSTKLTNVSVSSGEVSMGSEILTAGQSGMASSTGIVTTFSTISSGSANQGDETTSTFAAATAIVSASQTATLSTSTNMGFAGGSVQARLVLP